CKWSGLGRSDPRVILAGQQEDRRVRGAVVHAVIWRIGIESLELIRVLDAAELGDVEGAVGVQLDAQHIVDADEGNNGAKQLGPLRQGSAHEQAAVAATHDRQLFRVRVFLVDEILGAGNEVVEDFWFLGKIAGAVQFSTDLAPPAKIGEGVDPPLFQPDAADEIEARHLAAAVAAVAIKDGWILAVELGALLPNDV